MLSLTILCVYDPKSEMPDKEFELPTEFETSSQAELRALRWLTYRPNDIIMLVPSSEICRHCGEEIEEDIGWALHRWKHKERGSYLCWTNEHTKAEPKVDA